MSRDEERFFVQCGREITPAEIDAIRATFKDLGKLSQSALAEAVCEELGWFSATGNYKRDACLKLLIKLDSKGVIKLPEKQRRKGGAPGKVIIETENTSTQSEISTTLAEIGPVNIEVVSGRKKTVLWNEYVSRYHYLGYSRPIGCFLRYFITAHDGEILGCALFAGAAKSLRARDHWIGWSPQERLRNLAWVINNARYLILPWVRVPHLASHVLGKLSRRVADDWYNQWGYRPVLMETFVDPQHYCGTCYKAANWQYLSDTTGAGLPRRGSPYQSTPKMIFVRPLGADFRKQLCSKRLVGRVWE